MHYYDNILIRIYMATKQSTVDFILEQLRELRSARARKMFGEYALYLDAKVVGLICEDQLFIKYTEPGKVFAQNRYEVGFAYSGAKESMNVTNEIEDTEFLCSLVRITADTLPYPRPKKK